MFENNVMFSITQPTLTYNLHAIQYEVLRKKLILQTRFRISIKFSKDYLSRVLNTTQYGCRIYENIMVT